MNYVWKDINHIITIYVALFNWKVPLEHMNKTTSKVVQEYIMASLLQNLDAVINMTEQQSTVEVTPLSIMHLTLCVPSNQYPYFPTEQIMYQSLLIGWVIYRKIWWRSSLGLLYNVIHQQSRCWRKSISIGTTVWIRINRMWISFGSTTCVDRCFLVFQAHWECEDGIGTDTKYNKDKICRTY